MKRIIIVGDLFPIKSNIESFSNGDILFLFGEKVIRLFSEADLRVCNLSIARIFFLSKTGMIANHLTNSTH